MARRCQHYLLVLLATLACLMPSVAQAQSACTAMWGINSNNQINYFNSSTNAWVTVTNTLGQCGANSCNAISGRVSDGLLYFVDRTTRNLLTFNPANGVTATIAAIPAPPAPATSTNILGAAFDLSNRLFVYATQGSPNAYVVITQVDTATAATVTSWTQVRTTSGATPTVSGSGDINVDNAGVAYLISNTSPSPTYHIIDLTPGSPSFGRTNSPALSISGVGTTTVQGVAVDPVTGLTYFAIGPGTGGTATYTLDRTTGVATQVGSAGGAFSQADMGNCPAPPAAPTISKSFTPTTYLTGGVNNRTVSVRITIGNSNTQPIWTLRNLTDTLPAGMFIATPATPTGSCYASSTTAFGTATFTNGASGNINILNAGAKIPAGGCTLSFNVSATASLNLYTNTIPAGSLSTTAGSNAVAASATLRVGTDFSAAKQARAGTSGPFSNTTTIGVGRTMSYVLTFVNSAAGGTGTMTYTDTLRRGFTPVYSLTPNSAGGATTCSATTSTAAVSTPRVTGTFAGPPGSSCSITVTVRGSTTTALSVVNTVTLAAGPTTGDSTTSNNIGTSTVTIGVLTTLTIAKAVTPSGALAPNTSVLYTVTLVNSGPLNATPSFLKDPAVAGLSCTVATCTSAVTAVCPTAASTTVAYLQGNGIQLNSFPASSTLTFRIGCTYN